MNKPTKERIQEFVANYIDSNRTDIVDMFLESDYPEEVLSVEDVFSSEFKEIEAMVFNTVRCISDTIKNPTLA